MPKQKILKHLILSDDFKKLLKEINKDGNLISKKLLDIENKDDHLFEYTCIDRTDKDDFVTFIQSSRIKREEDKGDDGEKDFWKIRGRSEISIGRLIRRLFGTEFEQTDNENFVNKYKALIRSEKEYGNFELVKGKDIIFWYDGKRYESNRGTLGNSCMSGSGCHNYFGIYSENPKKVSLCILKNEKGDKIKGRAIVWKLDEPKDLIFMDRIYVNDDADINLFIKYAKAHGWATKNRQNYYDNDIIYPNGKKSNLAIKVILDDTNFNRYPYMDTLRYFYRDDKILSSKYLDEYSNKITLNDTGGYYNEFNGEDYEPEYVEDWRGNEILENESVWCEYDESYCLSNEAIHVSKGEHGRGKNFIPNSEYLMYSIYSDCYYHKDDVVYSEFMDDFIYKRYAVKMYLDQDKKKWVWNHKLTKNDTMGMIDSDYFINKIIYKDENDKYHFKDDEFYSYPVEEEPEENNFEHVPPGTKIDD